MDSSNSVLNSFWLNAFDDINLKNRVFSRDAVVVYSHELDEIVWANASGANLFGGGTTAEFIAAEFDGKHPFLRQLAAAVRQLGQEKIYRGFRIVEGGKSRLLQCEIAYLSDDTETNDTNIKPNIIVSCSHQAIENLREDEFSQIVLDNFEPLGRARAICDKFGLVIAASDAFVEAGIFPDTVEDAYKSLDQKNDDKNSDNEFSLKNDRDETLAVQIFGLDDNNDRYLIVVNNEQDLDTHAAVETADIHAPQNESDNEDQNSDIQSETKGIVGGVVAGIAATSAMLFGQKTDEGEKEPDFEGVEGVEDDVTEETDTRDEDPISLKIDDEAKQSSEDQSGMVEEAEDSLGQDDSSLDEEANIVATDAEDMKVVVSTQVDEPDAELESNMDFDKVTETGADQVPEFKHEVATSTDEFVFSSEGDPIRFRWVSDTNQVITFVSPELGEAVGPNAADLVGRQWSDIATVFGFDTTGEIQSLLEARDTWSGKSVLWPVQGTDLQAPIDLAALPSFSSGRNFEGFRGYGIVRILDTIVDPEETGYALVGGPIAKPALENIEPEDVAAGVNAEDTQNISDNDLDETNGEDAEIVASNIVALSSRRNKDRRPQKEDLQTDASLTNGENKAFREIGRKLRDTTKFGISHLHQTRDEEDVGGGDKQDLTRIDNLPINKSPDIAPVDTSVLKQLPIPVVVYRDNNVLFANPEFCTLLGFSGAEEINENGGFSALFDAGYEDDIDDHSDIVLQDKDGSKLKVTALLQSVPWDENRAYLLSFRQPRPDILPENEKVVLDMMRVSELQNILDTATDGIIVLDEKGTVISLNPSGEALFGREEASVRDQSIKELFANESHKSIDEHLADVLMPKGDNLLHQGCDVIGVEEKGGLIPLYITIGKIGSSDKLCAILRDMTPWKKAREELETAKNQAENANDQKTEFLARVSHEIRTPLNAIIGFSDVMIDERFGPVDNDRYREYLRDINRSGIHVLDLINDLLDISKIEAGKMDLVFEAVDLNKLVGETVALLQPQANGSRVLIRTSLSRAVPKVVADARSIRQIVLNLVSNAIKFTDANGQVIVSTVYEGNGEVALRVRDTGRGMSEEEVEIAMKPFRQVNSISETRGQGTGLGLPLTKALVEANKAFLDIESEPDEGTIVHIQFPTQRVLAD